MVTINSRKFDGTIHRKWNCKLLKENQEYWLFVGQFSEPITHNKLGLIQQDTLSYEYYFKNKWFNVFRFHEPDGELKFFYCNINMPPIFQNSILNYVDLDLDILVQINLDYEILDEDEFQENSVKYQYSNEILNQVENSKTELLTLIKNRLFPFNFC